MAANPSAPYAVLKLHGSLNWLRCEVCGAWYVNPRQRVASLEFWTRQMPYNSCHCDGRLRSVLVTPSLIRSVREPHLLTIWNAAVQELRAADRWVFIGYSLPQEDIAIHSLLLRAYHAWSAKKSLRVQVALWHEQEMRRRLGLPKERDAPSPDQDAARARYASFFPKRVYNRDGDYFPGGVGEVLGALNTGSKRSRPRGVVLDEIYQKARKPAS